MDLDSQVNNLFVKSNNVVQKSILSWRLSAKNTSRRDSSLTTSKDYRNIIERLQVGEGLVIYVDPDPRSTSTQVIVCSVVSPLTSLSVVLKLPVSPHPGGSPLFLLHISWVLLSKQYGNCKWVGRVHSSHMVCSLVWGHALLCVCSAFMSGGRRADDLGLSNQCYCKYVRV